MKALVSKLYLSILSLFKLLKHKVSDALFWCRCVLIGIRPDTAGIILERLTKPANFEPFEFARCQVSIQPTRVILQVRNERLVVRWQPGVRGNVVVEYSAYGCDGYQHVFPIMKFGSRRWVDLLKFLEIVPSPESPEITNNGRLNV